jgi:hypothetical protein
MTIQNYLEIQNNVVTNIIVWDGNTQTWIPPSDSTMLVASTTPAMVWQLNADKTAYVLTEVLGVGAIGFTWDGTVLTTNEPKPAIPA